MKTKDKINKITKINKDKLLLLSANENFVNSLADWRKKIGIDRGGFKNEVQVKSLYEKIEKALLVVEAAKSLMKNFNISKNYQLSIFNKILYGKFSQTPLNHSININGDYLSVEIYKKPTKDEWVLIKENVNSLLSAIESNDFNFLKKFNYPDGLKVLKPKRNIKRDLKILNKSKLIGKPLIDEVTQESTSKYSAADIEAEIFPEVKIEQSKRNIANIRKIKSRIKRDIKRTA